MPDLSVYARLREIEAEWNACAAEWGAERATAQMAGALATAEARLREALDASEVAVAESDRRGAALRWVAAPPPQAQVLADWLKRVFGPDVAAAHHADPMRDEDWLDLGQAAAEITAAASAEDTQA